MSKPKYSPFYITTRLTFIPICQSECDLKFGVRVYNALQTPSKPQAPTQIQGYSHF
jgi:hypothetical protein